MPERESTAKAQLKLRLREPLRARLEAEAKRNGYSLNTEIVRRLEASIRDEDIGAIMFGDAQMFGLMDFLARIIRAIEIDAGKPWTEDGETYLRTVETIYRILKMPQVMASGKYPHGVRDIADFWALAAVESVFAKDAERRADDA
jgi:hypothetical protein